MTKDFLSDWGPYSKKYMGVSKVIRGGTMEGLRFDLVVHPTLENSSIPVPNLTFPANFHPWEAAADLSYYSYRYELERRDAVYADVAFVRLDENAVLVRTEFVNDSPVGQNAVLNYYAALEAPFSTVCCVEQPEKCVLKSFSDYDTLEYHTPRPWEHLNPDAMRRGVFFDPLFYRHRGVGDRVYGLDYVPHQPFGAEAGDTVSLTLSVETPFADAALLLRGRAVSETAKVEVEVFHSGRLILSDTVRFADLLSVVSLSLGALSAGELRVCVTGIGDGTELDFAALIESDAVLNVSQRSAVSVPTEKQENGTYCLNYEKTTEDFLLRPLGDGYRIRHIPTGCLEDCLLNRLSQPDHTFDDTTRTFSGSFSRKHSDEGFYWNLLTESRFLLAGEHHVEYLIVSSMPTDVSKDELEQRYQMAKQAAALPQLLPEGEPYGFSGRLLRAALLTNVVYPVWHGDGWVKHFSPGKRWDCVYTWDSGFIGLGLLEWTPQLAEYMLKLYLSDAENEDFAFLFHGSPVPTQVYLYLELLQRSGDKQRLYREYPKLKRYYDFLAGKTEGSTTDKFQSRLTTTFDYFYNCSGMDDLPPQMYVHQNGLQHRSAPAVTASQLIRFGKILGMIAGHMGLSEDVKVYEEDIALRAKALQAYAWDAESGYFGYVLHDEDGIPVDVLRTSEGENLSKGVDGIYPLIAGVCTEEQKRLLLEHIFSEKEMFSKVGISSVDMSAGYFSLHGYWNGHVWMPHQWFIWKTMLDLGEGDLAWKIAETALKTWKAEADYSHNTYEMFSIATGRGGWFHQFGGLSSPVNVWLCAYFRPGNVSVGFGTWLSETAYDAARDCLSLTFEKGTEKSLLIAVLAGGGKGYRVTLDGEEIPCVMRTCGTVEIVLPENRCGGTLSICRK